MQLSSLPGDIGLCNGDVPSLAEAVNAAQQRLLMAKEAGDEGWWGTWAEVAFNVSRTSPFLTLPREIARLEGITVCSRPVPIENMFFSYLQFGNGRLPRLTTQLCPGRPIRCLSRNNAITWADLTNPPQTLAAFPTDPADVQAAARVLFQGLDRNDARVYSEDGSFRVTGEFVTLDSPFAVSANQYNRIEGIQKDATVGPVQIYQIDPTTGAQVLLLTMEPSETTAQYRRYYLDALPRDCCNGASTVNPPVVQVTAVAKLDFIPVSVPTDYLLIPNVEATIEEAKAWRYNRMDSSSAKQQAVVHHINAIRLLKGQLVHYLGQDDPAVNFAPFGSARLERLNVGMM